MAPPPIASVNGQRKCSKKLYKDCRSRKGWWDEGDFDTKKGGSGFHSQCKACRRAQARAYKRKNRPAMSAYLKKWQADNPERTKELRRNWYAANREAEKAKTAARKKANPIRYRAYQRMRYVSLGEGPRLTDAEWSEVLSGCVEACLACGTTEDITVDHIRPVKDGGTDSKDNVQPLCRSCNSSKKCKVIDYRPARARAVLAGRL